MDVDIDVESQRCIDPKTNMDIFAGSDWKELRMSKPGLKTSPCKLLGTKLLARIGVPTIHFQVRC